MSSCIVVTFYFLIALGGFVLTVLLLYKPPADVRAAAEQRRDVEIRKSEARRRKIVEKAQQVVEELGSMGKFKQGALAVEAGYSRVVIVSIYNNVPATFFEAQRVPGQSWYEGSNETALVPDGQGGFEVRHKRPEYKSTPDFFEIMSYIPGEWEKELERLCAEATAAKKQNAMDKVARQGLAEKARLEEERKRFGL